MKNSTLVMVCSLVGVCAGSAQAGVTVTSYSSVGTEPLQTIAYLLHVVIFESKGFDEPKIPVYYIPPDTASLPTYAQGGFYSVQAMSFDGMDLQSGTTVQFSNSNGGAISSPAWTSMQYSSEGFWQGAGWSAPVSDGASAFRSTYSGGDINNSWVIFVTASASRETAGANSFSFFDGQGVLIGSRTADLSGATATTPVVSTFSTVPAPGAVALLGLAGAFGARRRRN